MQKILVTGATGFLGSAVVASILRQRPTATLLLLLLVRSDNAAEGLLRIHAALDNLAVDAALYRDLTADNILIGDLSDVAAFSDDARLDSVTQVINCAAIASFGKNPMIWPVNVEGTFAFAARMARAPALQRFLHVGTAMACGPQVETPVHESWDLAPTDDHLVPYTASKAAIEYKLRTELPQLPLVVARPSIVVGHSVLGCKPSGSIFWVFRMAQKLERFTCSLDEKIDVISVDYCADALVALALKPHLQHDLYHISAGNAASCTFGDIEREMSAALGVDSIDARYRRIASDAIGELAHDFEERVGPCNKRLLLRALRLYAGFADLNYVFDNSRLLDEGIAAPPLFTNYVGLCAQSSEHLSIAEQMRWDFK